MTQPKILIVDDKPQNLYALELLLQKLDVTVMQATFAVDALGLTLEHDFCVAIVDVQMPEMDGYELVELLRGNEKTSHLPVIFVSAIYSDEYHYRKGYDTGAVDFLSKPFVPEILLSKVKVFIDLYRQRCKLEDLVSQLHEANATLEKRAVQLETSSQVGQQITSILQLDALLPKVVEIIFSKFGYYFVGIWLWHRMEEALVLRASASVTDVNIPSGFTLSTAVHDPVTRVAQDGQSQLFTLAHLNPNSPTVIKLPHTRSALILPLQTGKEKVGVLDVRSTIDAAFEDKDVTVLQMLASQVAIAIHNAQLYKHVVRFNDELEDKVQERTAELEQAYQTLEGLDRNKTDFIEIVAHELRTPLSLVKGYGEMLLADLPAHDEMKQLQVAGIVTGANRMHEIVNTMLDIIKIDTKALQLVPSSLSLNKLFLVLRGSLDASIQERQQQLSLGDMTMLPEIEADREALSKLFFQLLTNAIKYTPDGGQITVSARFLDQGADIGDGFIEVIVADTGIGIDPEFHELIFTKFYRTGQVFLHSTGKTKFKGGGPGLGLAIARGIVEAHGGRIWVESPRHDEEQCPGSTFHVVLPVTFAKAVEQLQAVRKVNI